MALPHLEKEESPTRCRPPTVSSRELMRTSRTRTRSETVLCVLDGNRIRMNGARKYMIEHKKGDVFGGRDINIPKVHATSDLHADDAKAKRTICSES